MRTDNDALLFHDTKTGFAIRKEIPPRTGWEVLNTITGHSHGSGLSAVSAANLRDRLHMEAMDKLKRPL